MTSFARLQDMICSLFRLRKPLSAGEWDDAAKRTVARFARGNIAAQNGRILFPDEQRETHERAQKISRDWREPAKLNR
jgi:hypothetical protein